MPRHRLSGYAVAMAAVAVAAALAAAHPSLGAPASPLFFAAVAVACWWGGLRAGLLATALAAAVAARHGGAALVPAATVALVGLVLVALLGRARDAQQRAERQVAARDELLDTLAHELRTPLNAVVGWLWWLRQGELDGARRARALETVERNAGALTQLTEDLLDVARILTGKLRLERRAVPAAPLAAAAVEALRSEAEARAIELATRFEADPGPVLADPERLQQIVCALLRSALAATPEHGRVEVTLTGRSGELELRVAGGGDGLADGALPDVLDAYRHADALRLPYAVGLRLAIARHLVEAHGGRIRAERPGAGRAAPRHVQRESEQQLRLDVQRAGGVQGLRPHRLDQLHELGGVRAQVLDIGQRR